MGDMNTQVKWSGRFWQGGQANEMWFNHMIMDQHGKISGNGSDAVGGFSLSGHCSQNGHTEIHKTYHGAHTVIYRGQMDNDGWIRGNWDIPGNCNGTFELHVDQPSWNGYYQQGGQKHDMNFTKYYYGAHSVQYKGQHHKEHGTDVIRGDWCIPGNSWDHFELKMHH